jgi:membrane-associated protease RseP (regulator of RpoE activity)
VKVLPSPVEPDSALPVVATGVVARGGLSDPTPRGRLGIGLQCSRCGTELDRETGRSVWFFSGPIEVTSVAPGGPAESAGIQMGDLVTAVDGHDLTTEAGGSAFSDLIPGEAVNLTVVRRNGRKEVVTVVPAEPVSPLARGVLQPPEPDPVSPTPRVVGVAVAPPPPSREDAPEPATGLEEPLGLPLSFTGTLTGVEVTVRGGPVAVSELKGARTIIIQADGVWIRVRIPAPGGKGEGGTAPRR